MSELQVGVLMEEEYRALKGEMLLRVAIQNMTILGTIAAFVAIAILATILPNQAGPLAMIQSVATLALALQWCHQGVRQCALKQAILRRDAEAKRTDSWENWLPGQRPSGPLGSRWFVSTKAVFIGLPALSTLLALPDHGPALWCAAGVVILITIALLTNPRE